MRTQLCHTTMKAVGDRTMSFTISTAATDRDNDTIDPQGWDVANYMRNPVVLWAHDYSQPPIAKAVNMRSDARGLHADVLFPPEGLYQFADTIHNLCKSEFLNATSVGFTSKDATPKAGGGYLIKKAELLEFSIVTVPSNPTALVQRRGVDMAAMKTWFGDSGDHIDWDGIGNQLATQSEPVEVDISEADVIRCMTALIPSLREGLKTGLRMQAEATTHSVFCRMTGRLD